MTLCRGDALTLPIRDESVDLVVTSPPYFALRSYTDNGEHYEGQVGSEAAPGEFVEALLAATAEMVRVLKPSGSIWVNLGDKYVATHQGVTGATSDRADRSEAKAKVRRESGIPPGFRPKSLMGLPWRYAIGCIDRLGLILRAEVIWSKPNGLPESVTDRVRRSHEQWFHMTREGRYFAAMDELREPGSWTPSPGYNGHDRSDRGGGPEHTWSSLANPLGKLPGSVWQIPTEPLRVPDHLPQHFAAFPSEWPRRIILGWSPKGICEACGEGRAPRQGTICEACGAFRPNQANACPGCGHVRDWKAGRVQEEALGASDYSTSGHGVPRHPGNHQNGSVTEGESCACPDCSAPTRPAVVLDPFCGTGTVPLVAEALGRTGVGVDLSSDYLRLATWRSNDPTIRSKVRTRTNREAQGVML